jgi:hypothetical protein
MEKLCSFCKSNVVKVEVNRLDLWICPNCYAAFFAASASMAFRRELFPMTRKLWLDVLETKEAISEENVGNCLIHQEALVQGILPNYGLEGRVASCCDMLHLPLPLLKEVLKKTLETSFMKQEGKHHFAFIRLIDRLVSKILGNETISIEDDPIESMQYHLYFKKILEPENETLK